MAVTYVDAYANQSFGFSPVFTRPTGPVLAGDLMILSVTTTGTALIFTPPAGWSQLTTFTAGSSSRTYVYVKIATASEPASYTTDANNSGTWYYNIVVYRGAAVPTLFAINGPVSAQRPWTGPTLTLPGPGPVLSLMIAANRVGAQTITDGYSVARPATAAGTTSSYAYEVAHAAAGNSNPTSVTLAAATTAQWSAIAIYIPDSNRLPTAPTSIAVPDAVEGTPPLPSTWVHNDPDGNPQVAYQGRWRKGTDAWSEGKPVPSTTAAGDLNADFLLGIGSMETGTLTSYFGHNDFFGTYPTAATITASTARFKTGARSMEVTWPTASRSAVTMQNTLGQPTLGPLTVGKVYEVTADLWVPAGSPDVSIDPIFVASTKTYATLRDQWQRVTTRFTAANVNQYLTLGTDGATVAGQKVWVDNLQVREVITPGTYEGQVRTSDAAGFGPWSASDTFVISPATNVYKRVSGVAVPQTRLKRVSGTAVVQPVTVIKRP